MYLTGAGSQNQPFDSISLPLWDQHRLLAKIQYALEKACFTFAQERLSYILQSKGWDCAEAGELNQWSKVLLNCQHVFNPDTVKNIGKPLPSLMDWVTQLRHDAVHRVRLSSSNLLQRMTAAMLLARLLQDNECSKMILNMRKRTEDALQKLLHNKQLLDHKLAEIKKEFVLRRAELERQEAAMLAAALSEHNQPFASVSGSLEMLAEGRGDSAGIHAPWKHGCDATLSGSSLPGDESSGPKDSVGTHVEVAATESAAKPVATGLPHATEEETKKVEEKKMRAGKEQKSDSAKQSVGQQEELGGEAAEKEESAARSDSSQQMGKGDAKPANSELEMLNRLIDRVAPLVNNGSVERKLFEDEPVDSRPISEEPVHSKQVEDELVETAIIHEYKKAEEVGSKEGRHGEEDQEKENVSGGEPYFAPPELEPGSYGSDLERLSKNPSFEIKPAETVIEEVAERAGRESEVSATSQPDVNLPERRENSQCEPSTSHSSTHEGRLEVDSADQSHTESPVGKFSRAEQELMDLETLCAMPTPAQGTPQPGAANNSRQGVVWQSYLGDLLGYDPSWKALSKGVANEKEDESAVLAKRKFHMII